MAQDKKGKKGSKAGKRKKKAREPVDFVLMLLNCSLAIIL